MGKKIDITGLRFGKLTVIKEVGKSSHGEYVWKCMCDCGNYIEATGSNIRKGHTTSCGCTAFAAKSKTGKSHKVHGDSQRGDFFRLYKVWLHMRERCNNSHAPNYKYYGGRGISVCEEWNDFEKFKEWSIFSGYSSKSKYGQCTLDRVDVNGNYEPENCRWVDMKTQARNRRNSKLTKSD